MLPKENVTFEVTANISSFKGEYRFLSNFYPVPIMWQGIEFYSTEVAYQASKTTTKEQFKAFAKINSYQARTKGATVTVREDWDSIKLGVMESLLRIKFLQNSRMGVMLRDTYPKILIEGNTWGDVYWGMTLNKKGILVGENNLGRLLTKVRQELIKT